MAPAKPRSNADDVHGAASNFHAKVDPAHNHKNGLHGHSGGSGGGGGGVHHPAPTNGKARRTTAATAASATASAAAAAAANAHQQALANGAADAAAAVLAGASNPTIQWSEFERGVLHAYRRAYRLDTPGAFSNDFHHWILSQPGSIGLQSPTMMRRKALRRQSKAQLANAARKHFNGQGVQENDIVVEFLHKIQTHEIVRLHRPRRMGSNAREVDG